MTELTTPEATNRAAQMEKRTEGDCHYVYRLGREPQDETKLPPTPRLQIRGTNCILFLLLPLQTQSHDRHQRLQNGTARADEPSSFENTLIRVDLLGAMGRLQRQR